jgi:hypothetical protein
MEWARQIPWKMSQMLTVQQSGTADLLLIEFLEDQRNDSLIKYAMLTERISESKL